MFDYTILEAVNILSKVRNLTKGRQSTGIAGPMLGKIFADMLAKIFVKIAANDTFNENSYLILVDGQ